MSNADKLQERPFWLGPLGPCVCLAFAVVLLFHDGFTPYRLIYRRQTWDRVPAMPAKITVPYMRTTLRPGLSNVNRSVAEGERSALGARERSRAAKTSPRGRKDEFSGDRGVGNVAAREEIYQKRMLPNPIHSEYVTTGVGVKSTEKRWYVRLSFEYFYEGRMYSVQEDEPLFHFNSREAAESFLRKHADEWPITVWVNPADPEQATAFLLYDKWHWVQIGSVLAFLSLLWFIIAGVGSKQFRAEAEKKSTEADEESSTSMTRN